MTQYGVINKNCHQIRWDIDDESEKRLLTKNQVKT